ncbi:MAG: Bro-N domain-containing protein [Bacteroidales bacterium]
MSNIKLFESKQIRTVWNETDQKWYFVITDVVQVLTDTPNPSDYIKKMRKRDEQLSEGWGQIVTPLSMDTAGGKQKFNCANAKGLLRIIQSIHSPKAEPFKQWLAQVGSDRLDEIENPELATQRTRELYKAKGYPDDWIEKRMRSIAIREELTEEWKNRGVNKQIEYSVLTAEISKATFGLTPSQYKKVKGLKSQNLRDHMTDLELIFSMLGEASTTKVTRAKNAKGFIENKKAAKTGGKIAGNALKELEKESGEKVITSENYLPGIKKSKELTKGNKL